MTGVQMDRQGGSGGSGGGSDHGRHDQAAGVYTITGNGVEIVSRVPMAADLLDLTSPGANTIVLLATGETPVGVGPGGLVGVRGNQGVRITAGPPLLDVLPITSPSTDGIELSVAMTKKITLQQGLEQVGPSLEMSDGGATLQQGPPGVGPSVAMSLSGIKVESGLAGSLTFESMTNITFKVAGGLASITLTPTGVEIKGLIVSVN